ncbi:MAG TPA: lipocalin-like domain-containing protein, partial [Syntrophales bacterium]|nr:lipocalin-like domain-containing protein [Syntrophales bacterium]
MNNLFHFFYRSLVAGHWSLRRERCLKRTSHALLFILFAAAVIASAGAPAFAADDWKQAVGPRTWSFPRDHGAHPEFRTEWWYFTGNLRDGAGNRYGYQLTFFRQGVRLKPANTGNPWS